MNSKREQAMVGLFVIIAAALLLFTVFMLSGAFSRSGPVFHATFSYAGGLEEGTPVRYAGGPKVGSLDKVEIDPNNPKLIEITFRVNPGIPVKTDTHVKIGSLSALGDNHLELVPGSEQAPTAPNGAWLPSDPYIDFSTLTAKLNDLAPDVQKLLVSLNERATDLKVTVSRVNDLLNDRNRANFAGTLAGVNGMIAEDRGELKSTVKNLNAATLKLDPLLQELLSTSKQANLTLNHVDALVGKESPEIHAAIVQLRTSLATLDALETHLDQVVDVNAGNIDELLENLRQTTENLNQFTDTIKTRPSSLIRSSSPKTRKPGDPQ